VKTLVTGGKGYLGAEVVKQLVAKGFEVVSLDLKDTPGRLGPVEDRVTMIGGGIGSVDELVQLIRVHEVTHIAHMVYSSANQKAELIHQEVSTMVMGTTDVFEAARRTEVRRIVFPSSVHYYGPQPLHGNVAINEDAPSLTTTAYGVAKHLNEVTARSYISGAGMSIICLRLPALYGPNAIVGARGVNVAAVQSALEQPAVLPYPPDRKVCVCHVEDAGRCTVKLLFAESPRHFVYNVGGHAVTYWELAAMVKMFLPGADIRFDAGGADSDLPYLIDDSRIQTEFGISTLPLEDGIRDLIDFTRRSAELPALRLDGRGSHRGVPQ
jgi:UDP-glucose 4-epimerase